MNINRFVHNLFFKILNKICCRLVPIQITIQQLIMFIYLKNNTGRTLFFLEEWHLQ